MRNKRENYCKPTVGVPNQYMCTADTQYACKYFLRDDVFMSECVHFAMHRCTCIEAKRDSDKGA